MKPPKQPGRRRRRAPSLTATRPAARQFLAPFIEAMQAPSPSVSSMEAVRKALKATRSSADPSDWATLAKLLDERIAGALRSKDTMPSGSLLTLELRRFHDKSIEDRESRRAGSDPHADREQYREEQRAELERLGQCVSDSGVDLSALGPPPTASEVEAATEARVNARFPLPDPEDPEGGSAPPAASCAAVDPFPKRSRKDTHGANPEA